MFKQDIEPLEVIVTTYFDINVRHDILLLIKNYKENIFTNENANKNIHDIIKREASAILRLMSRNYLKYIKNKYFTEEGIIFLIISLLSEKIFYFIQNQIQPNEVK